MYIDFCPSNEEVTRILAELADEEEELAELAERANEEVEHADTISIVLAKRD